MSSLIRNPLLRPEAPDAGLDMPLTSITTGLPVASTPVAPEAAPAPVGTEIPDFAALQAENAGVNAAAQKGIASEKINLEQYKAGAKKNLDEQLVQEQLQNAAAGEAMNTFAEKQQNVINMQNAARTQWDKERAQFDVQNKEYMQQLNDHIAASHPTDIWGAAGINPIMGSIGLALGQLGSFMSGTNSVMEIVKAKAASRAQQLQAEGVALGAKGSELHRLAAEAESVYSSKLAGSEKLQAALLRQYNTQMDIVANKYANPIARLKNVEQKLKIDLEIGKLEASADSRAVEAKHNKFKGNINIAQLALAAGGKAGVSNTSPTERAKLRDQAQFAMIALEKWRNIKELSKNPIRNAIQLKDNAVEMFNKTAQGQGIPGSSIEKFASREAAAAGMADPLSFLPGHGTKSSFVIDQKSFNAFGRNLAERLEHIKKLLPPEEAAQIPGLTEFEREQGGDGGSDIESITANAPAATED